MNKHSKIGLITGGVVFVVNMTENIFHYNVGKQNGNGSSKFTYHIPTKKELAKMAFTSIIAGVLVGYITKNVSK
jgi:hypothetical protein